ncbi:MAG TPA: 3'-5' exonuclease [Arcobacter sp.]|nr:3'-5' exonuclease [Arcobacter sp.]
MNYVDKLVSKLLKSPLTIDAFNSILESSDTFFNNVDLEKELIISNGLPLFFNKNDVSLKTKTTKIEDQVFCIVDIETNAGNAQDGQIIEIGAIKFKNGKVIETYQSLVTAKSIPLKVQEITGITPDMLVNAPSLKTVLEEFKIFLEDDVFVAHSIDFDYKFVSDSFKKYDLGELLNRKLCTIQLAKRTIKSKKYGLRYLKEKLNIDVANHHRAFDDALSTVGIFKKSLNNLCRNTIYTEDLLKYSKTAESKEIKC